MTRKCFFVEGIEPDAEQVVLSPKVSHHLEHVLRCRVGDRVEIRDGLGNAWAGEIAGIAKGKVAVRLLGIRDFSFFESPLEITLALGFAGSEVMDLVIRQAAELGVARLVAFRAARSQYGLASGRVTKKVERWTKIVREAICQCGRTRAPGISVFEDLDRFLESVALQGGSGGELLKIFARETERDISLESLRQASPHFPGILAVVGPEGGWDGSEIVRLTDAGFCPVHLGPRILRFETAAIALVSSIQLLWGDLGEIRQKEDDRK